jgi:hypothetical protein
MAESCSHQDLARRRIGLLLWGAPWAVVVFGACAGDLTRAFLWAPSFTVMGIACVLNARRCGRLHCYVTGPLFLLAAVATALVAFDVVRVAPWWIMWGAVTGTLLAHLPEWVRGRYVQW